MNNPFAGSMPPVRRLRNLIGREDAFTKLEQRVRNRQNTVIMGPEGIGKSSLLNCFFNRDFRIRMAREEELLIAKTAFPVHLPANDVYHYLAEAIFSSLDILPMVDPVNAEVLRRAVEEKRKCKTGDSRLQETCKVIDDHGYDITLVFDDFENFTSSQSIEMDHHATMRTLFKSHYANYVVATNYDFNKDSLPPAVSGSFLLMEFSKNELPLDGFDLSECRAYLEACGGEGCFTDQDIANIRQMSGGIPALLRITAEVAWERKQTSPVLNDGDWDWIQDQLFYNDRVREYMNAWCRMLTGNQLEVFKSLLDDNNTIGVVTGENGPKAASALHMRRLLVPRRRGTQILDDCYEFNSDILLDYCYNTVLTVSEPHDVQKHNISKELRKMVDEGRSAEVIEMLRDICGIMGNVTMPFDFDEPMTDELLQQFELNLELLHSFDPDVQDLLVNGIRVERTFIHVQMKDYAPVYLSFAKAIEAHLNLTVVPVLKKAAPNHIHKGTALKNMTGTLMLGELVALLNYERDGLRTVMHAEAARYCKKHGCAEYDENWWQDFVEELSEVKEIRNDMPHVKPLSDKSGVELLRKLFQDENSFMSRCANLRSAIEKAASDPAEDRIQEGTVLTGTVRKVMSSGAFVDIGMEKDGYLYIAEVRKRYVSDLFAELKKGQQVRVEVLNVDPETGRINLSMKNVPQK